MIPVQFNTQVFLSIIKCEIRENSSHQKNKIKMSQNVWVAHDAHAKTFGPTKVSIEGCEYVDDLQGIIVHQLIQSLDHYNGATHYRSYQKFIPAHTS